MAETINIATTSKYQVIENEIVERLKAMENLNGPNGARCKVMTMPDNESEFRVPTPTSVVTVAYTDSKFDPPDALEQATQQEGMNLVVNVASRTRRGPTGVLTLIHAIQVLLLGFKPEFGRKLYLTNQGFSEYENGEWQYSLTFSAHGRAIQQLPEPDPIAFIEKLQLDNQETGEEIITETENE